MKLLRKLERLERDLPIVKRVVWEPISQAQSIAYHCPADETFYGGQPGGGKTDLLLALALQRHRRSLVLRRRAVDLAAIKARLHELTGVHPGHEFTVAGRSIQLGGCRDEGTKYKYQGQPHDLKAFDEVTQFLESQYSYITIWNRTAIAGQACRVVSSFNPPTAPEHRWVLRYLAPWLDPRYPKPAASGEVRFFVGQTEVPDASPVDMGAGKLVTPRSRCFVLSHTGDNALLGDYSSRVLDHLPAELAVLMDFSLGIQADPWQVIPTAWVEAAQARWCEMPLEQLDSVGIDPSRGGVDLSVLALRIRNHIRLRSRPGREALDADAVLGLLVGIPVGQAPVYLDAIGVGAAVEDVGRIRGFNIQAVNNAGATKARDRSGRWGFRNIRAAWWWRLRELLDPAYGATLALPLDERVLPDLTASRFFVGLNGIQIESKEEVKKRLGWSPDTGDAIVLSAGNLGVEYSSSF